MDSNLNLLKQIRTLMRNLSRGLDRKEELMNLVKKVLDSKVPGQGNLLRTQVISPVLTEMGDKFHQNEISVPELLFVIKGIHDVKEFISRRYPATILTYAAYPIVIGNVQHDTGHFGKKIVAEVLEAADFPVFDLGTNISPVMFAVSASKRDAKVVALSCFLTQSLHCIAEVIKALEESALRKKVKVIAGGAAVKEKVALDMGADAYGADAWEAVVKTKDLLGLKDNIEIV